MWRVAPLLVLAVIAYGCGTSENPTAPQSVTEAGGTLSTTAKLPKVDICHITGNGKYVKISVSENAKAAHLAHGDGIVGEDLDENCEPLAPTACVTFTSFEAVDLGYGWITLNWAADTTETVSYTTEGRSPSIGYPDWMDTDPPRTIVATGPNTFSTNDYFYHDEYRIAATCPDGSLVFSPISSPW